jgi:uncharacterized membrane protein
MCEKAYSVIGYQEGGKRVMNRGKSPATKKVIIILLLIGFLFMEFPGVFFFKDIAEPYIFGLPFIYGYILIWWAFMCIVMFVAYKTNWGDKKKTDESEADSTEGGERK